MLYPLHKSAWDRRKAAHLLNRAGFGGPPEAWEALYWLGPQSAVDSLLNNPDDADRFPKPDWAEPEDEVAFRKSQEGLDEQERLERRRERQRRDRRRIDALVEWWIQRMVGTPFPLREKMTLFWHGHFATSANKVRQPYYHWLQNETFRQHALGNFGELTRAIMRDPAMLLYLDGTRNRKNKPNENFAREMMELFTLGIGHYSENDVREAARAFTGYKVEPSTQSFRFLPKQHDGGTKEVLRVRGRLDGDDVIDILLKQPSCAPFLARKLLVYFVQEKPPQMLVDALATELVRNRFGLAPTLRTLFCSQAFYEPAAMNTQIKSPVQWLVGTLRMLEAPVPPRKIVLRVLKETGQLPFHPPSVKGWDGGRSWITTSTLLARYNAAPLLLGGGDGPVAETLFARLPESARNSPPALAEAAAVRLFQSREEGDSIFRQYLSQRPPEEATFRRLLVLMMSTPQYQLT